MPFDMKNTYLTISALFIVIIFTSASCKKKEDEWKIPTEVGFKMDINRSVSSGGNLIFSGGQIILESFRVKGKRDQGADIEFRKEWPSGLSVAFSTSGVISGIDFDIPQGTYSRIEIDFDTFDDLGDNCILVNGTFTNSIGTPLVVRFEYTKSEFFSIVAEDESGDSQIVLDKDVPATSEIVLDPVHWFQVISDNMLESADTIHIAGVPTIVISEDENDDIYDLVLDRLDESTEAVFNF